MHPETDCTKTKEELMADSLEEFECPNVIGLLMTMREIQQQKPLSDPDILAIDKDGTAYY